MKIARASELNLNVLIVDSNSKCKFLKDTWFGFLTRLLYRKAVGSQSPGLPLRLPWVTE